MRNIKFITQHCAMDFHIVFHTKIGINICERRSNMLPFANQASSFHLWEHGFPVVLRVRMTLRIKKRANIFLQVILRCRFTVLRSDMNRGFVRSRNG